MSDPTTEEMQVIIFGPSGTSYGSWNGPVPMNGDRIKVSVSGPGASDPYAIEGIVVGREWHHHTAYPMSVGWRISKVCHIFVVWELDA